MNILITICARGGSKGIPKKNVKLLAGKPLISYSIEIAIKFANQNKGTVALSTDSFEIQSVAAEFGVQTSYIRPGHLASDKAGKVETIKDLLLYEEKKNGLQYEYVLDLDVTSPLRTLEDLGIAMKQFSTESNALTMFSVNHAAKNPYFNMVEQQPNGFFDLVKKQDNVTLTRQSAAQVFDLNASFYFYRREFFNTENKSVITEKSMIYVMPHVCFDLDQPIDFEFLDYLITNKKLDFIIG